MVSSINDQVTAVGASLRGLGRANYSVNERNNIIYTEGLAPGDNLPQGQTQVSKGTSFAAPPPSITADGYTEIDPLKARRFLAEG